MLYKISYIGYMAYKILFVQIYMISYWAPRGFGGSGENGYLFLGSWGALVIISRDLGSKLMVLGI